MIFFHWEVRIFVFGGDLNALQNLDAIGIFFPTQMDVIEIPRKHFFVLAEIDGIGCLSYIFAGDADSVIVITDAKELYASGNGGFDNGFGLVFSAKGIIRVRVKILNHSVSLLFERFVRDELSSPRTAT